MPKFKTGDMVQRKYYTDKYYPSIDKFEAYPVLAEKVGNGWNSSVRLIRLKGKDGERWYLADNFQHWVAPVAAPSVNPFKVGDRVQSKYSKRLYTVAKLEGEHVKLAEKGFENWPYKHTLFDAAPSANIKEGDKVRVVTKRHGDVQYLDEGRVSSIRTTPTPDALSILVNFAVPGAIKKQSGMSNSYAEKDLTVISEFTKYTISPAKPVEQRAEHGYIISLVNAAGQYAPATTPKQYYSLKVANEVAIQMAEKHGRKFVVLKPVSVAVPPKKTGVEVKDIEGILN